MYSCTSAPIYSALTRRYLSLGPKIDLIFASHYPQPPAITSIAGRASVRRTGSRSVGDGRLDRINDSLASSQSEPHVAVKLTFLDAIFLWSLVVWVLVLLRDALGALFVVVLCGSALGGLGALCGQLAVSSASFLALGLS